MPDSFEILHVDDDRDFADLTKTGLTRKQENFTVTVETDASNGMELLKDQEFDCVVSDYQMPETDGLEFLSRVRNLFPDLPFILFTGKGSEEIASQAISEGVTDYIQKDGSTDTFVLLKNRVLNAVQRYHAEKKLQQAEQRFQTIADAASDAIVTVDESGTIVYANPGVERTFGFVPDELEGSSITKLIPNDLQERHEDGFGRYLATGERQLDWSDIRFPARHKNGERIPVSITFNEIHQDGGRYFSAIIRYLVNEVPSIYS